MTFCTFSLWYINGTTNEMIFIFLLLNRKLSVCVDASNQVLEQWLFGCVHEKYIFNCMNGF